MCGSHYFSTYSKEKNANSEMQTTSAQNHRWKHTASLKNIYQTSMRNPSSGRCSVFFRHFKPTFYVKKIQQHVFHLKKHVFIEKKYIKLKFSLKECTFCENNLISNTNVSNSLSICTFCATVHKWV